MLDEFFFVTKFLLWRNMNLKWQNISSPIIKFVVVCFKLSKEWRVEFISQKVIRELGIPKEVYKCFFTFKQDWKLRSPKSLRASFPEKSNRFLNEAREETEISKISFELSFWVIISNQQEDICFKKIRASTFLGVVSSTELGERSKNPQPP